MAIYAAACKPTATEYLHKRADEIMTAKPRTIEKDILAAQALATMEGNLPRPITSLFVLEQGSAKPIGIIHLHDILKAGIYVCL